MYDQFQVKTIIFSSRSMLSFLHTNPEVEVEIDSDPEVEKRSREFTDIGGAFLGGTGRVSGKAKLTPPIGKTVSHRGIVIELFGDFRNDSNKTITRFLSRKRAVEPPGDLVSSLETSFSFDEITFPTGTYFGTSVNVVYGIEVRVVHRIGDFVKEQPFTVVIFQRRPRPIPIHKEIGMANVLHIEFVFPKGYYGSNECVVGAAYFLLIKLRIVSMSISLYRNEVFEGHDAMFTKKTVLKTYEVMDGAPCRGDHMPLRIFLGDQKFWPYIQFPGSPLTVEHYLRVVMVDENNKYYFKRLPLEFGRYVDDA